MKTILSTLLAPFRELLRSKQAAKLSALYPEVEYLRWEKPVIRERRAA